MDFMRDQLFARAGFAEDEHGSFRGRDEVDLADDLAQRAALADQIAKCARFQDFFFEICVLLFELIFQALDFLKRPRICHGGANIGPKHRSVRK